MTWSCQEIPKIGGIRGMTGLDAGAVSSDSEPDVAHSRCWIGGRSGTDTRLAAEGLCKAYQQRNHHGIDQTAEWRRRAHDRFQIDAGDPNSRIERPTWFRGCCISSGHLSADRGLLGPLPPGNGGDTWERDVPDGLALGGEWSLAFERDRTWSRSCGRWKITVLVP